MKIRSFSILAALCVVPCVAVPASAADTAPAQHIRGTVSAVSGNVVTVTTARGPVVVTIGPKTNVAGVAPATIDDITVGTFIGTANVPSVIAARALEVVVFPKALAGTGEGDYPWDLPAGGGKHSAMTNGTVAAPNHSSMTNATVRAIAGSGSKSVTLAYKGGTKMVVIPSGVPIVKIVPATKASIVVGAHVFVVPPASNATFIIVGEGGAVPPM